MYAVHVNLYAILILFIIFLGMKKNQDIQAKRHRYFFWMVYTITGLLFFDMISELVNGATFAYAREVGMLANVFLYGLSGFAVSFWFLYVNDYMKNELDEEIKQKYLLLVPAIIVVLLSIVNIFVDVFFLLDENNVYQRGPYFLVYNILLYGYLILVLSVILRFRKRISKQDFYSLLSLPLLPAIGGILQILVYGLLLIWPFSAVSIFILYVFIQSQLISVDALTELANKRQFLKAVNGYQKNRSKDRLGVIVMDIDGFKRINDTYGHYVGDLVLKTISNLFKRTFSAEDLIARTGGDEFIVLLSMREEEILQQKLTLLEDNLCKLNKSSAFPFELSLSKGVGSYDFSMEESLQDFIIRMDKQMYAQKNKLDPI